MSSLRMIVRTAAALVALALVSCIDGREEYWLEADRSGRAEATYSFPAAAARMQGGAAGVEKALAGFLARTPAITRSSFEVTTAGDRMTVHVAAAFDSVLELRKVGKSGAMNALPSVARGLTGDFSAARDGRQFTVTRTIRAGDALPGASWLPASRLAGHALTYIVHLPEAAGKSNATRTADGGRTLVWEIPLAQAVRRPVSTEFTAPIPISRGIWAGLAAGGFALLLALGWLARRLAVAGHRRAARL